MLHGVVSKWVAVHVIFNFSWKLSNRIVASYYKAWIKNRPLAGFLLKPRSQSSMRIRTVSPGRLQFPRMRQAGWVYKHH